MSVDIDPDEFYTPDDAPDTRATTIGSLPEPIGVLLLFLGFIGVLGIGTSLGYPSREIAVIFGTGLLAAVGVRIAASQSPSRTAIGVTLLWVAAVIFTVAAVLLVSYASNAVGSIAIPLLIAAATLLVPFGILGSTLQSFGHGAGRAVLSRYLTGCLVLSAAAFFLLLSGAIQSIMWSTLSEVTSTVTGGTFNGLGVYPRAVLAFFVYTVFFYALQRTAHGLPFEVFVSPEEFDRVTTHRATVDRVHQYGLMVTGLYFCTIIATFVLSDVIEHPAGDVTALITELGAALPLIGVFLTLTVLMVGAVMFVIVTRRVTSLTGMHLLETFGPPAVILVLTTVGAAIFGDTVATTLTESAPGQGISEGGILYQIITGQPSLVLLMLVMTALLSSAIVLSIPSFLAGGGPGDASLTGVAAGVIGIVVLVFITVITHGQFSMILGGVLLAAIIWEIGEYSTVAAGELRSPQSTEVLPDGFTTLTAVHTVATTIVAIIAAGLAILSIILIGSTTLTVTTALVTLILSSIALAALIALLSG